MFRTPSGFRISVMTGRFSVRSPNSTRPARSPRSFSASRPVSSFRKGAESNCGSSAISSSCSLTAGVGSTATETEANLTGRPSACDALERISAWTRGVSTTSGRASAAAITKRISAATTPTIHFEARVNAHPPERLSGLDRRETPELRAHGAREGPVLFDVLRRLRAVDERAGRVVHGVVHERSGEIGRHPVLATLLPRFADLDAPELDLLDAVRLPRAPELVALALKARVLLRREPVGDGGQIPTRDRVLDVGERALRPLAERRGIEARVHLADVADAPLDVRRCRRRRGDRAARATLAGVGARAPARIGGLGHALARAEHAQQEEGAADDQQDLEEADTAAEPAAEEHRPEETADREPGAAAPQPA